MSLKKQFAVTLASVGLGAALIGGGTFAWFNATAQIEGNTFAAGTMKIGATPASAVFNVTNLKPGDWMERSFVVENEGSITVDKLLMNIDYTVNDANNNNGAQNFDENLKVYLLKSTDENIPFPERVIISPNNGKTLKELKAMGKVDVSSIYTQFGDLPPGTADKIHVGIVFENKNEDQNRYQGDSVNLKFGLEGTQKAGERR